MSDNPGGSDDIRKLRAELDLDVMGFDAGIDKAEQSMLNLARVSEDATSQVTSSFANMNAAIQQADNSDLNGLRQNLGLLEEPIQGLDSQIKQTTADIHEMQEAAAQGVPVEGGRLAAFRASGAGADINPDEMPEVGDIVGGGEGGGSVGSLFGVARGARGAAALANAVSPGAGGGVMAGADILMTVQGFRALGDVLPAVNASIEAAPGLLAPVVAGFTALGVPMAGLLAVALPVVAAIAAVGIAISGFINLLNQGKQAIDEAAARLEKYYGITKDETQASIQEKLAKSTDEYNAKALYANDLITKRNALQEDFNHQGDLLVKAGEIAGMKDLDDKIKENQKNLDTLKDDIDNYNKALGDQGVITNTTSAQIREQTDAQVKQQAQFAQDDQLTSDAAKNKITALQGNIATEKDAIAVLQESNKAHGLSAQEIQKNKDAIAAHQQAMQDDKDEVEHLKEALGGVIAAREEEADRIKKTEAEMKATSKAVEDLHKQEEQIRTNAANQAINATTKEAEAEKQYYLGSLQDKEARRQIELKESRDEEKLAQDTADKIDDINTKLANKLVDIQTGLDRAVQDDQIKFSQNYGKMIRDANDQEEDNQTNHLRKLADIQTKSQNDDQMALLDRNFLALAKNEQSKQQQEAQENTAYQRREDDLARHLDRQTRELQIKLAQDEAQDLLQFARKREDAIRQAELDIQQTQITEQRKRQALLIAEGQQLTDLTTGENYKLQLLRQGLATELQLYKDQENQRLLIAQQTQEAIIRHALGLNDQIVPNAGGGGSKAWQNQFGDGGSFGAGEGFFIGDKGAPEMLDLGAGAMQFNGAAYIMPSTSGSVTPIGGGNQRPIQMHNEWHIHESNNPEATINLAIMKMEQMLDGLVGN